MGSYRNNTAPKTEGQHAIIIIRVNLPVTEREGEGTERDVRKKEQTTTTTTTTTKQEKKRRRRRRS